LKIIAISAFAAALAVAGGANATAYVVDAYNNSSTGGTGVLVGNVTSGQALHVSVNPGDLWNAGSLPRWSNADGLTGNLYATGTDDSGQANGTLIGMNFGSYTQGNLTAAFGTLVGEIGGVFAVLGTNYNGTAWGTGALKLYYWDSNNGDNSQYITANVTAGGVPEPATWALMIGGFGLAGAALRRRAAVAA